MKQPGLLFLENGNKAQATAGLYEACLNLFTTFYC